MLDRTYDGFMFNAPPDFPTPGWSYDSMIPRGSKFAGMRYCPSSQVLVYGVAVATVGACYSTSETEYQSAFFTDSLWGMLLYRDGNGHYIAMDSARMRPYLRHSTGNSFKPLRYFYYGYGFDNIDTLVDHYLHGPLVEIYFDNPVPVNDTFYVGLAANSLAGLPINYLVGNLGNHAPPVQEDLLFLSDTGRLSPTNRFYFALQIWGGFFPIISPYEEMEGSMDDTVQNFHLEYVRMGYPTFAWNTSLDPTLCLNDELRYEVQYAPYRSDEWLTLSTTDSTLRIISAFDPGIYYQARIRAYHRHLCPMHDTLAWGEWSHPILFYTGSTPPDTTGGTGPDTTGINPVEAAASLFTLTPNPTTGTVRVEMGDLEGELALHDAAGHEVLRMTVEKGQKSVELDLAALPKGTYLVTLATPTGTGTQRLVLQ